MTLDRPTDQPDVALEVLDTADAFSGLLALEESPRPWGFRLTPNAARTIDVPARAFLQRWISGAEIGTLATEFLSEVESRELAVEQIVDAVFEHCEHFLSWTLGVVISIVNAQLAEEEPGIVIRGRTFRGAAEKRLCENLPLSVRYGVDSAAAVELISSEYRVDDRVGRDANWGTCANEALGEELTQALAADHG